MEEPSLFSVSGVTRAPPTTSSIINAQIGSFHLSGNIDGHELRDCDAAVWRIDDDRSIFVWSGPFGRAELLTGTPHSYVPDGMLVTGVRAALWRVVGTDHEVRLSLRCHWAVYTGYRGGEPLSGEYLDTQTWTDSHWSVTLGCPEYDDGTLCRDDDGYTVNLLLGRRQEQRQFVVAWAPYQWDNTPTWFAVDCSPNDILREII